MKSVRRIVSGALAVALVALGTAFSGTAEATHPITCGQVITQSTTLHNDVGPCTGDGLVVGASDIQINLNGKRVFGNGSSPIFPDASVGIRLRNTSRVTVSNGRVDNFAAGVAIEGGERNAVVRVTAQDNIGSGSNYGDGIAIFNSSRNLVYESRALRNGPYSGISMVGSSSYNSIRNNIVHSNTARSTLGGVRGGATFGNQQNMGIRVEGPGATYNRVAYNVVVASGSHGIVVMPACNGNAMTGDCPNTPRNQWNLVEYNRAEYNGGDGIAFALFGPADVVVLPWSNTARYNNSNANVRDGISVAPNSRYNVVTGNTANGNQRNGINVSQGAASNRLTSNYASRNYVWDGSDGNMDDPNTTAANEDCDHNVWSGNTFGTVNQRCVRGHTP